MTIPVPIRNPTTKRATLSRSGLAPTLSSRTPSQRTNTNVNPSAHKLPVPPTMTSGQRAERPYVNGADTAEAAAQPSMNTMDLATTGHRAYLFDFELAIMAIDTLGKSILP